MSASVGLNGIAVIIGIAGAMLAAFAIILGGFAASLWSWGVR